MHNFLSEHAKISNLGYTPTFSYARNRLRETKSPISQLFPVLLSAIIWKQGYWARLLNFYIKWKLNFDIGGRSCFITISNGNVLFSPNTSIFFILIVQNLKKLKKFKFQIGILRIQKGQKLSSKRKFWLFSADDYMYADISDPGLNHFCSL